MYYEFYVKGLLDEPFDVVYHVVTFHQVAVGIYFHMHGCEYFSRPVVVDHQIMHPQNARLFAYDFCDRIDQRFVRNVKFKGGCNGNLKALAALTEGMTVDQVKDRLLGITCGLKNTSCSDQFAHALIEASKQQANAQGQGQTARKD